MHTIKILSNQAKTLINGSAAKHKNKPNIPSFIIFFLWLVLFSCPSSSSAVSTNARIVSIRTYLYFHSTGEVDTTDLNKDSLLFNTLIGEGMTGGRPSRIVLAKVEVAGFPSLATLSFIAKTGSKILSKQVIPLRNYYEDGKNAQIPIFIYDIGCDSVEIIARIEGSQQTIVLNGSSVKKTLPFGCGE